jgi:hypothetical protein
MFISFVLLLLVVFLGRLSSLGSQEKEKHKGDKSSAVFSFTKKSA